MLRNWHGIVKNASISGKQEANGSVVSKSDARSQGKEHLLVSIRNSKVNMGRTWTREAEKLT